ncbi:MAG: DsrE family protein [Thiolinea sp.]
MKKLTLLLLGALLGASLLFIGQLTAQEAKSYGKQKVVYHINYDDPQKQQGALANVQNHINAVGAENLDLKVVLHGNGLSLLIVPDALESLPKFKHANADDSMAAKLDGLRNQGVAFAVCNNTVTGRGVSVEDHLYNVDQEDIVPSGVAELAHLQGQGYATSNLKPDSVFCINAFATAGGRCFWYFCLGGKQCHKSIVAPF